MLSVASLAALVLGASAAAAPSGDSVTLVDHGGPTRYASLAQALAVAKAGDTLLLADGVFSGPDNTDLVVDVPITILGRGSKVCTIDCGGTSRAFWFRNSVRLEGITIRNGYAESGGAVLADGPTSRFVDVRFVDNAADVHGGAVWVSEGFAEFSGCRFVGNVATFGGGAAIAEEPFGGASCQLADSTFLQNSAELGGGLWVAGSILLEDPLTTLTHCHFEENSATTFGGGLGVEFADDILIDRCKFVANHCDGRGGGIGFNGDISPLSDSITVRNSWVVDNTAGMSAGIAAGLCGALIHWTTIANNVALDAAPGGLEWSLGPGVLALNSIFWGNESPAADTFSDQITVAGGVNVALGSDIQGLPAAGTNLSIDPLFVDAAGGDYHLAPLSPCIDAGVPNGSAVTSIDIDGGARLSGAGYDIGADEVDV